MTYTEVIKQIKRLSSSEQQTVYRELQRTLKKKAPSRHVAKSRRVANYKLGVLKPTKNSSLFKVLGALREEGKAAPTDKEVEQMIADYLLEKHS